MIQITELNIEVEDVSDFNDRAGELLTAFCDQLETDGMTEPISEDDENYSDLEGFNFLWSSVASDMIRKEIDNLYAIGRKYFGDTLDLDISTHMFIEP